MNPDSFCTEFKALPDNSSPSSDRRLSTSWDNEMKSSGLAVPRVDQRRNSNTLAQLLECYRQLSLNEDQPLKFDLNDSSVSRPTSRRASAGSRKPSVAEMLIDNGANNAADDCIMVTQTLGTSTTLFFQKNPLVDNLDLRPSAVERGLYNFDDSIKEVPSIKFVGTPRPSIQMTTTSPRPSLLAKSSPSIDENDGEGSLKMSSSSRNLPVRPSLEERGLPAMKFTPVLSNGQLQQRGRTLQKQPRTDPRFDYELDRIIATRRKIVDEEETKRERKNQIRPRTQQAILQNQPRPHNFDGRGPYQVKTANVMEELRNQMERGEVDRIVKEKKTTTVTETREIVYFTHRLPSSIAISTRLSPTGVPAQNRNRGSLVVEGSLPELLDRPYVRASPSDQGTSDGKAPLKSVTIRVPDDHSTQPKSHVLLRSATPSPNNTSIGRGEKSASP